MIKKHFSMIFVVIAICLMLVAGIFISTDRIKSVNAEVDITPYNLVYLNSWTSHTSSFNLNGNRCWSDGTNLYYSNNLTQYVFDFNDYTWSGKSWNGLVSFNGNSIWTDGTNIYYSSSSNQYVLNISTSTWSVKTWNGLTSFDGFYVWSDGTNFYYSEGSGSQYVLDVSTSTWTTKTWTGLTSFYGNTVWTDGTNIYCSSGSYHYVLDVSTSTWSVKIWNGLTNFSGAYVWTDGTNIYYSSSNYQYVLDISTSTWRAKTWSGLTSFDGNRIYSSPDIIIIFGDNITTWYTLDSQQSSGGDNTNTYYHYTGSNFNLLSHASSSGYYVANMYFDIEDISITEFTLKFNYLMLVGAPTINNEISYTANSILNTTTCTVPLNSNYTNSAVSNGFSYTYPFIVHFYTSNWSNSDIVGCSITSSTGVLSGGYNTPPYVDGVGTITYIFRYFNSSNDSLFIELTGTYDATEVSFMPLTMINRTYYFSSGDSSSGSYQEGYDDGYYDGLDTGFNDGINTAQTSAYNEGYNVGYNTGYSSAFDLGYDDGYLDGASDNNDYTLFAMISAVVDAPLQAFTNLFNFNLFGFNLLNLFTGLLTLVVLIAILRFLMGGK